MTSEPEQVYRPFIAALNAKDFGAAATTVDPQRYRETCVAFTAGEVARADACAELQRVWDGIPDPRVELEAVTSQRNADEPPRRQ